MIQENASLKGTSPGLATMLEKEEKEKGKVTQLLWKLLKCCMDGFEEHIPLFLVRSCKNQQAKAC
jgi:hypothetical protein